MERRCEQCGGPARKDRRFCGRACAAKYQGIRNRLQVDEDYDWKKANQDEWVCRYYTFVKCTWRNCAKCGWNPEVAKARTEAFSRKGEMA